MSLFLLDTELCPFSTLEQTRYEWLMSLDTVIQ